MRPKINLSIAIPWNQGREGKKMELPSAVKAGAEKAEALQKQLANPKPQDNQDGTTPQSDAQPVDGTSNDGRDTSQVADAQNQTPKADTPPVETQQDDAKPPEDTEETWQQRFLALQGKYNAEVPRLNLELRNLQNAVSVLQTENKQLKEAANSKPPIDQNGNDNPAIDPQEFSEYGPEFVQAFEKLQAENNQMKEKLNGLVSDVQSQQPEPQPASAGNYNNYMNQVIIEVAKLGANFDNMNTDAGFLGWLKEIPVGMTEPRVASLRRAESLRDVVSTVKIFEEYLGTTTTVEQQPAGGETPQTPAPVAQPNIQPAPSNTGTDNNPPVQNQKIWSRAEIKKFYADKAAGVYRGRDEEATALEQDIFLAQQQGRVGA